jgi:hypothetical protein
VNAFAADPFGFGEAPFVGVDVYTAAYRVSGQVRTRFERVADIVNQVASTHLVVEQATVSQHDDPAATVSAQQVLVTVDEILFVIAAGVAGAARSDMRITKRPIRAQIALPPFRLTGLAHIPQGGRPADGLVNAAERFMAMTEVTIACAAHPELARTAEAVALQRRLAHLMLVADDENPDQLLADVLDRATAEHWLRSRTPEEGS